MLRARFQDYTVLCLTVVEDTCFAVICLFGEVPYMEGCSVQHLTKLLKLATNGVTFALKQTSWTVQLIDSVYFKDAWGKGGLAEVAKVHEGVCREAQR